MEPEGSTCPNVLAGRLFREQKKYNPRLIDYPHFLLEG
jgi:hypothetical protein